jgi:hypothetical protein
MRAQLIIFMALAGGRSRLRVGLAPTLHTRSAMAVAAALIPGVAFRLLRSPRQTLSPVPLSDGSSGLVGSKACEIGNGGCGQDNTLEPAGDSAARVQGRQLGLQKADKTETAESGGWVIECSGGGVLAHPHALLLDHTSAQKE